MNPSPLILAGVDPGGTTGLVIAVGSLRNGKRQRRSLKEILCQSLMDPRDVVQAIQRHQPHVIFIETRASHSSSLEGIRPYETIMAGMETLDYIRAPLNQPLSSVPTYVLIPPSSWKPVMEPKEEDLEWNLGRWHPATQHEKDALNLLHYGVMFYLREEVKYE